MQPRCSQLRARGVHESQLCLRFILSMPFPRRPPPTLHYTRIAQVGDRAPRMPPASCASLALVSLARSLRRAVAQVERRPLRRFTPLDLPRVGDPKISPRSGARSLIDVHDCHVYGIPVHACQDAVETGGKLPVLPFRTQKLRTQPWAHSFVRGHDSINESRRFEISSC